MVEKNLGPHRGPESVRASEIREIPNIPRYSVSSRFEIKIGSVPLYASMPLAKKEKLRMLSARTSTSFSHNPQGNCLLAALTESEFVRLYPHLELVDMPLGQVLCESGGQLQHVYFPVTSIVSLLYVMENGSSAEIAVVGNEGILGISLFMGGETSPNLAVVQSEGVGYRLPSGILKKEFNRSGSMMHLLLRYTQALITQMSQTAACNRHHSVNQQLCRWLLLSLDRLDGNELKMTQELISNMLGVRREGVTEASGKLRDAGLIEYRRGHIKVLDRPRLERTVCECYGVVKKEFDRLLSDIPAGEAWRRFG